MRKPGRGGASRNLATSAFADSAYVRETRRADGICASSLAGGCVGRYRRSPAGDSTECSCAPLNPENSAVLVHDDRAVPSRSPRQKLEIHSPLAVLIDGSIDFVRFREAAF